MVAKPQPRAPWGEYVQHVGPMTVERFEWFPGEAGWVYELHYGRLIVMPGPGDEHANVQENFFATLGAYIRTHGMGRLKGTSCYNLPLPDTTEELLCPDMSFVEAQRLAVMPLRRSYRVGAPDLVIEIASPRDTHPEVATKMGIYLRAGVRLGWVAWPQSQTIEIWRPTTMTAPETILHAHDMLDGESVIPGFQCSVHAIFAS
jgi:Uma2 family endonuclease